MERTESESERRKVTHIFKTDRTWYLLMGAQSLEMVFVGNKLVSIPFEFISKVPGTGTLAESRDIESLLSSRHV